MNARRKKSGARAVPARKAASGRQSVRKATQSSSAKKPARVLAKSARRAAPAKAPAKAQKSRATTVKAPANGKSQPTLLGTDCTIEHAPALHAQLAKVLVDRACVTLDFSAVKRCDTAGLQLLAAFIRERREAGLEVALTGASDNFLTTANVLGLAALFGAEDGAEQAGVA